MVSVVKIEGQPTRVFRELQALVVRRNRDGEPTELHLLIDDESLDGGDRVEILTVLIPEECFTTL